MRRIREKKNTAVNNADILPVTLQWVLLGGTFAMRHCFLWAVQHINQIKLNIILKYCGNALYGIHFNYISCT